MGILREKPSPPSSTSPCACLRSAYYDCFIKQTFVKGQWQTKECVVEWRNYGACLPEHLQDKQLSRFLEAEDDNNDARGDLRRPNASD